MTVIAIVANRTEKEVNLYWAPDSDRNTKGYKLYTSLEKDTGYVPRINFIQNSPAPSGRVPAEVKKFIKPGHVSATLNLDNAGITCEQEFFVKVSTIGTNGMECSLASVPYAFVRLEGNNRHSVSNINTDTEKAVIGWDEDNNTFQRINASPQLDSAQAKFALDVHLTDSKVTIENPQVDGNAIPLNVQGLLNPSIPELQRTFELHDGSLSELESLIGSAEAGLPYKVHSIAMQSDIAIDCDVLLKLRINGGEDFVLDRSLMSSSKGDTSYFFSTEDGLILSSTDMLVLETEGLSGQSATLKVTALVSALNKG